MKIETVKWKWADKVQSKGVYRDDEFIRTQTAEEALKAIDFLLKRPKGLTYTITVLRDGEYFTYFRHSMPCLGGLVKYRDSHGERYEMNPYFPRDIYVAFPEGEIIYIGCYRSGMKKSLGTPYYDFILSSESPWVSAFGNRDSIIFEDNYFILTNMHTDPTVFYSLMRLAGFTGSIYAGGVNIKKDYNPRVDILLTKTNAADPRRLAAQLPIRISGGSWAEGFGYTRPYNESIFKTSLPHTVSEFKKLSGYPQAPYDNSYFIRTMKEKFGIATVGHDQKSHDALVEAWDFFKEEAKNLTDVTEKKPKIVKAAIATVSSVVKPLKKKRILRKKKVLTKV